MITVRKQVLSFKLHVKIYEIEWCRFTTLVAVRHKNNLNTISVGSKKIRMIIITNANNDNNNNVEKW